MVIRLLQFPLASPQFFLQLAVGANVPDDAGDEDAFLGRQRAEADLDGKLLAVLPQAVQVQARSHRPNAGIRNESSTMSTVFAAIAFRHQNLDRLTEQLAPTVSEKSLGLAIDLDDLAILVGDDDRIRCRFQETLDSLRWQPFPEYVLDGN